MKEDHSHLIDSFSNRPGRIPQRSKRDLEDVIYCRICRAPVLIQVLGPYHGPTVLRWIDAVIDGCCPACLGYEKRN